MPRSLHVTALVGVGDERLPVVDTVRAVRRLPRVNRGLVHAVAQHVVHRAVGSVDRQLREVGAAEPGELRVEVGEQPGLHERVVGRFDAWHEVAGVECDLFGLGEVVGRVAVEGQLSDQLYRDHFLGHDLGRIEQVDALDSCRCRRRA